MKRFFPMILTLMLILTLAIAGCGGGNPGGGNPGGTTYTGVAFTMIAVPSQGYEIAQTEVTYELWGAVHTWALANGYPNLVSGTKGSDGSDSGSGSERQPVTHLSWQDAVVWCNALTEYYAAKGGTGYKCVYYNDPAYTTPIRSIGDTNINTPYIYYGATTGNTDMANCTAKGFRLPTSSEWYQAARYIDGTIYYLDTYASGADADINTTSGGSDFDGDGDVHYTSNVAVYSSGTTARVMSKFPNKLGLYDMSGNVHEWCFDLYNSTNRVMRGGGYTSAASALQISGVYHAIASATGENIGFRPAKTQ